MDRRKFIKKSLEGIVIAGSIGSIPLISGCKKNPVSPDNDLESITKIAFTSNREGNYNIYTINPDGSDLKQLTNNKSTWWPSWSPDGKKIAYSNNNNILIMNSDGTNQTYLTDGRMPTWSPDGEHIVYVKSFEIYTINLDGGGQEPLVVGSVYESPSWSPDATKILLHQIMPSILEELPPMPRILIIDIKNNNLIYLDDGSYPSWSPDGTKIIYSKYSGIWEMDTNGDNKKELLSIPFPVCPTWSPDGGKIAYSHNNKIWIMNSDGKNQTYLTDGTSPDWSPFLK